MAICLVESIECKCNVCEASWIERTYAPDEGTDTLRTCTVYIGVKCNHKNHSVKLKGRGQGYVREASEQ